MTEKESGKFLNELAALYPNVIRKDSDFELMFSMWHEALKEWASVTFDKLSQRIQRLKKAVEGG